MNYQTKVIENNAKFGCAGLTTAIEIINAVSSYTLFMLRADYRRTKPTNLLDFPEWYKKYIKTQDSFIGYMANNYEYNAGEYVFTFENIDEICEKLLFYYQIS